MSGTAWSRQTRHTQSGDHTLSTVLAPPWSRPRGMRPFCARPKSASSPVTSAYWIGATRKRSFGNSSNDSNCLASFGSPTESGKIAARAASYNVGRFCATPCRQRFVVSPRFEACVDRFLALFRPRLDRLPSLALPWTHENCPVCVALLLRRFSRFFRTSDGRQPPRAIG